jgi:succinate-semialdehyde dehydrogenase/glutarate-semialdehyde dehydrogenase
MNASEAAFGIPESLFRQANWIDGVWIEADGASVIDVINPATGAKLGRVPKTDREGVRLAIRAAQTSLVDWRKTLAEDRSRLLKKIHSLINEESGTVGPPADVIRL